MRTHRPFALLSATALAGATLLGGAGIAGASTDSLGSLLPGSSEPAAFDFSITDVTTDDDDETTVTGTITNTTSDVLECGVLTASADVISASEAAYEADPADSDAWFPSRDDELARDYPGDIEPEESWDFTLTYPSPGAGVVPAYLAECFIGGDGGPSEITFVYDPVASGSLDLGSLDVGGSLSGSLDS